MPPIPRDGAVVVLAGRRIDAEPTSASRFPFDQVDRVGREIADCLRRTQAVVLLCSAACGADLVALETAQKIGLDTYIVLPFSAGRFRERSVVDRPRPELWGSMFDRSISVARGRGTLIELDNAENEDAYLAANAVIIDEARKMADVKTDGVSGRSLPLVALVVWEGESRGIDDATHQFAELARHWGFRLEQILTVNTQAQGTKR